MTQPHRGPGGRLGRIRDLLADGLNLAGIARVLELEDEISELQARLSETPEGS